ncbi:MAG: sensor histidine kinase, partial [Spirochaetota bacterium]
TPTSILVLAADGTITHVNRRAGEVLGVDPAEVEGLHRERVPWRLESAEGEPLSPDRGPFSAARRCGREVFDIACTLRRPDGERRRLEVSSAPLLTPEGEFDGIVAVLEDVTARRADEERVRTLLEEKELLIREIHHRVKNDLNLVQSLASLQKRHSSNEETAAALDEMINRLAVMSRVYDALRTGGDAQRVALDEVLTTVVDGLRHTTLPPGVVLELDVSPVLVRQTVAVTIGIMVNELVTNSVRHGLADAAEGTIAVLATANGGMIEVVVVDSGPGFPASFLREPSYGYGLTIVDALARQHEGSFELGNENGARARVVLPLES